MKIKVLFSMDRYGWVSARELRKLIRECKIVAFERADGWVKVGVDPLRGDGGCYDGPERRNIIQDAPDRIEDGCHFCSLPENRKE